MSSRFPVNMSFIMFLSLSTCFAISSAAFFYDFSAGLAVSFFLAHSRD